MDAIPLTASALADLPPPPPGKAGWPWTVEGAVSYAGLADPPRITIVTPSYNQAAFIEETIRSVLLQGYPNLEYIVMDGGSTDGSLEIIRKYESWITYWTSSHDGGQSDAINKGFRRGSGAIMAWLNSDDIYLPGALHAVAAALPIGARTILLGATEKAYITEEGPRFMKRSTPRTGKPMHALPILADGRLVSLHFIQPSMFWTRDVWEATGELDTRYHYVMDLDWCNRALALGTKIVTTDAPLARFAVHPSAKTQRFLSRANAERALMYWRLGHLEGFRRVPCLLLSLDPLEKSLVMRAKTARFDARLAAAVVLRVAARAVRALRVTLWNLGRPFLLGHP